VRNAELLKYNGVPILFKITNSYHFMIPLAEFIKNYFYYILYSAKFREGSKGLSYIYSVPAVQDFRIYGNNLCPPYYSKYTVKRDIDGYLAQ
jgi:hypothetical protein